MQDLLLNTKSEEMNNFSFTQLPKTKLYEELYEEVSLDARKIYKCLVPNCGKIFKFKSEVKRHTVIHSNQRPYVCSFPGCEKTFKRGDALSNHFRIHSRKTPFQCPIDECSAHFTTKSALRYHLLKHGGEKSFKCSFSGCCKAFLTYAQLKQHEKASYYHQKIVLSDYPSIDDSHHSQTYIPATSSEDGEKFGSDGFDDLEFGEFEDILNSKLDHESSEEKYEEYTSVETQEESPADKQGNRSVKDSLLSMLNYMMEENKLLKKKLKYTTEVRKGDFAEKSQTKSQSDVDLFFRSTSFGSESEDQYIKDFPFDFSSEQY